MNRVHIKEQVFNFIAYLLVQLPLLYRITLFDRAFAFFYVGFLLLLPFNLNRVYLLLIGFFSGLIVDAFSNTPGIHASACVLIIYLRNMWIGMVQDDLEDFTNINHVSLGKLGLLAYTYPLILVHHFVIFTLENGGFHLFGILFTKVMFSSFFSFSVVFVLNYLIAPKSRRV